MIVSGFINAQLNSIHTFISLIILIFIWSSHSSTCIHVHVYVPFHYTIPLIPASLEWEIGQNIRLCVYYVIRYTHVIFTIDYILCISISAQSIVGLDSTRFILLFHCILCIVVVDYGF